MSLEGWKLEREIILEWRRVGTGCIAVAMRNDQNERVVDFSCALVTGASSGLGEEFAMQLAGRVGKLVLVARRVDLLERLAGMLRSHFPGLEVVVFAVDLSDAGGREHLVAEMAAAGMIPDLLVNNAGMGDYGEFASAEWGKLETMIRLNVEGLTHLTHALLPGMIRRREGAVVNVSSLASLLPIPDFAVYAASKAYVTSFSEALKIELRGHGVEVLAVCPGPVHTGFGEVARRGAEGRNVPGREWFFVAKETVVAEALLALRRGKARVYPGLRTVAAAVAISLVPIVLMRLVLGFRPRKD